MASSHAYTFRDPADWEELRRRTRTRYAARYGKVPPEVTGIVGETLESNQRRFAQITAGLARLKREFEAFAPDVLIVLGDDQDEHFEAYIPQFAIYLGQRLVANDRVGSTRPEFRNDVALAQHLYAGCVDAGIDLCGMRELPDDLLLSHAHVHVLTYLKPTIPVIPVFLNAIQVPAPSPQRCYAFGEALLEALSSWPGDLRVAVYASGGLSHFSAGFPYGSYAGPHQVGSIAEQFDRDVVEWMRRGEGARFIDLPSAALLENGDVEMRQWITLLGMLGERKPQWLIYEPFYRAVMGMSVGVWEPFMLPAPAAAPARLPR
jgi:hypothetical protein